MVTGKSQSAKTKCCIQKRIIIDLTQLVGVNVPRLSSSVLFCSPSYLRGPQRTYAEDKNANNDEDNDGDDNQEKTRCRTSRIHASHPHSIIQTKKTKRVSKHDPSYRIVPPPSQSQPLNQKEPNPSHPSSVKPPLKAPSRTPPQAQPHKQPSPDPPHS